MIACQTQRCTPKFRFQCDEEEVVPARPEVLIVPELDASIVSLGRLHQKRLMVDLLSKPPASRSGQSRFLNIDRNSKMSILPLQSDEQPKQLHQTVTNLTFGIAG